MIRGIIGKDSHSEVSKTMVKIKDLADASDYKNFIQILRSNQLFKANSISREFNYHCPSLHDLECEFSTKEIISRINENSKKIELFIDRYCEVIYLVSIFDFSAAIDLIDIICEDGGVSVCVIKILIFIRLNSQENSKLIGRIDSQLKKINIENIGYLYHVIRELSSSKTDYFTICKKVFNAEDDTNFKSLANSFVNVIPSDEFSFVNTLNACFQFSLIDAVLYYLNCCRLNLPFLSKELVAENIVKSYYKLNSISFFSFFSRIEKDEFTGLKIFREAFLLIEVDEYFKYRVIHSAYYNSSEDKAETRIPIQRELANNYFSSVTSLKELKTVPTIFSFDCNFFNKQKSCYFERSSALIFYIESKNGDLATEEKDFVELMSVTRDIGIICTLSYLKKIKYQANDLELKLVSSCLVSFKDKSQIAEHDLRKIIQDIATLNFDSNLKKLLDYIFTISPAVTEHLIQLCDEVFISKLFHLTKKPNQAIESRAELLEWYGAKIEDQTYIDRAKNLRIDVQINKEKGTIDDARIYVDPVKFTQWLNDNIVNTISILFDSFINLGETSKMTLNWDRAKTGISIYDQIGHQLIRSYDEFCTNKFFGIASYLGRRIRHGTFKGTGTKDVKDLRASDKYKTIFLDKDFSNQYDAWFSTYESLFDQLASEKLHINSKIKSGGMISSEIKTPNKKLIANHMLQDMISSFTRNNNLLEAPYIITEYCWRLIEEDLSSIRKMIMEKKSEICIFKLNSDYSHKKNKDINNFCKELNAITAEKFRLISSWFSKPSIASPSADLNLLCKAVVSEVKGQFDYFNPQLICQENEYSISGGAYFIIYDALYILIFNSARHGKTNGTIFFNITYEKNSDEHWLQISLSSQIKEHETEFDVRSSIESALTGDFEDAHIIEGRSGIKKLRRMEKDGYIHQVNYRISEHNVIGSFNFRLNY